MKKWLFAWACGWLLAASAVADEISIFSGDGSPPKMYVQDGHSRGILVDILAYADEKMPLHNLHGGLFPWARAYMQSSAGRSGIMGLSWSLRRDDLFDYSAPLFVDEVVVVVRKDRVFPFKSLADLRGKRVGMVRGASFGEEFQRALDANLFVVDGDGGAQQRLNKLMLGRIDCALFNVGKPGFEEALRINKMFAPLKDALVVLPVPLRRDPNYLAFPKEMNMKPWLAEFNQVITQGYASGDIQRIVAHNLGK